MKKILLIVALMIAIVANAQTINKKDFAQLKSRADSGYYDARCTYAYAVFSGMGTKADQTKGIQMLRDIMAEYPDSSLAPFYLATALLESKEPDTLQAVLNYKRAADQGDVDAMDILGISYLYGDITDKDYHRADDYLSRAVAQGSADGYYYKGEMLYNGIGCDYNKKTGLEYIQKAYEMNHPAAAQTLGDMYLEGVPGVLDQDLDQASECYRNGIKWGNNELILHQADLYEKVGDTMQADHYYNLSAEAGYSDACYHAASMYADVDNEKCVEWAERGAKMGNMDCYRVLAYCQENGLGTKKDVKKAAQNYMNDTSAFSCSHLGHLYLDGSLGKVDQNASDKGIEYLEMASKGGDIDADNTLGTIYRVGTDYVAQSYDKSADYYKIMADAGEAEGQYWLGRYYEAGVGVTTVSDTAKALRYLRQAAEQNHSGACIEMGNYYRTNNRDAQKAFRYYGQAANQEDAEGNYMVGRCYMEGCGADKDTTASIPYLKRAAQLDNAKACETLGDIYNYGTIEVIPNGDTALTYYYKGATLGSGHSCNVLGALMVQKNQPEAALGYYQAGASYGDADCIVGLGECLMNGTGVKKSMPDSAYKLYQYAASQYKNSTAYLRMGACRMFGTGCTADEYLAQSYMDTAATLGNTQAMYILGVMYIEGYSTGEPDAKLGLSWIQKSAALDYEPAVVQLGDFYAKGFAVDKDETHAFNLYMYAADTLHGMDAVTKLGDCYHGGVGVKVSTAKAVEYYTKAANQGYVPAMRSLAELYSEDYYIEEQHIEPNPQLAMEWMQKAADAGDAESMYLLGEMYEQGNSAVAANTKTAKKYYEQAAKAGFEAAKDALKRLK